MQLPRQSRREIHAAGFVAPKHQCHCHRRTQRGDERVDASPQGTSRVIGKQHHAVETARTATLLSPCAVTTTTSSAMSNNRSCDIHSLTMRHGAVMGPLQRDAGGEQQHRCVDGARLCTATIADTARNDIDAIDVEVASPRGSAGTCGPASSLSRYRLVACSTDSLTSVFTGLFVSHGSGL